MHQVYLSVKYDIRLNKENLTNKNITIKSILETNKGRELIKTGENTYTGVIPLNEIKQGTIDNIKIEIEWKDEEENNSEDTKIGIIEDYKLEIPIIVHLSQYLGEEIVAYE